MAFLTREEMQERLTELGTPELSEVRRAEIIMELGNQHISGLQEFEKTVETFETTKEKLHDAHETVTMLYGQTQAEKFGGEEGRVPDVSFQETVTLEDLLG